MLAYPIMLHHTVYSIGAGEQLLLHRAARSLEDGLKRGSAKTQWNACFAAKSLLLNSGASRALINFALLPGLLGCIAQLACESANMKAWYSVLGLMRNKAYMC